MSTNKTKKYHLHAWKPEDNFLLQEINENFAALDSAVGEKIRAVAGIYTGADTAVQVDLGGRPLAVLIENPEGIRYTSSNHIYGGLVLREDKTLGGYAAITATGFTVVAKGSQLNGSGRKMSYLAFMPTE